ncbi:MAG: thermostable hemolysin [Gammaproteobacteria bacterium]
MLDQHPTEEFKAVSQPQIQEFSESEQADVYDLKLLDQNAAERQLTERFISKIFHETYAANLQSFYPFLLTIKNKNDQFSAVAGVRPACLEKLFSENYLEKPIDEVLKAPREKIIEIGNLAPADAGQARWLIATLSSFMNAAGFTNVVFTAVPQLRNSFRRMGLPLSELAKATADHLPEDDISHWGNYYNCNPVVFVGDLRVGKMALSKMMAVDPLLNNISTLAQQVGENFKQVIDQNHLSI